MNLPDLGFLLPLMPLFVIPLLLVAAAWIDRRRHAIPRRRGATPARAKASGGPLAPPR